MKIGKNINLTKLLLQYSKQNADIAVINNIINTRIFFVCFVLFLSFVVNINAQKYLDGVTPDGLKSVGSESFESINPYTGNLNISVPILNIKGRGQDGYQMAVNINRRWRTEPSGTSSLNFAGVESGPHYTGGNPYGAGAMVERHAGDDPNCNVVTGVFSKTITYFTFVSPDGSETDFYDDIYKGATLNQNCNTPINHSRGNIFYSTKGDGTIFISDQNVTDHNNGYTADAYVVQGYLKFKNGVTYRVKQGHIEWIQDANGNKTIFTYQQINPGNFFGPLLKITDSLNREVTIDYATTTIPYDQINYKGNGGAPRTIKIYRSNLADALKSGETLKTINQLFPEVTHYNDSDTNNPVVTTSIQFPDQRSYDFKYNSYSEVAKVKLPSGGVIEYDRTGGYINGPVSGAFDISAGSGFYRRVIERRIFADGINLTLKTNYSRPETSNAYLLIYSNTGYVDVDHKGSNGVLLSRERHYYLGYGAGQTLLQSWLIANSFHRDWQDGLEHQTDIIDTNGTLILLRIVSTWQPRYTRSWGGETPQIIETQTTHEPTSLNLIKKTSNSYDQYGNITDLYEYDYGSGQPGTLTRHTHTDYVPDSNYANISGAYLPGLPTAVKIYGYQSGQEFLVAQSEIKYDETALTPRSNVVGWTDLQRTQRGNPTTKRGWLHFTGEADTWLETKAEYDVLGNVVKTIDAKNNISTITYDDNFGVPDNTLNTTADQTRAGEIDQLLNGKKTFAFPTSVTNPFTWTAKSQIDYHTGAAVNTEDINGVISKTLYNDLLDRPTQTVTAVGLTGYERQTTIIYDDDLADRRVETKSDFNALNDNLLKSESFYDGLGRIIETRRYESDGSYIATKTVPFEMIQDPQQTSVWRAGTKVSNPYRQNETPVWTMSLSDSLGRTIKVISPDEAIVKTEYSGNAVTVTDQALKQRRSITNALGQLTEVHEPNNAGQLGTITSPNQPTFYNYDVLNNLVQVQQNGVNTEQCGGTTTSCTQTRTFAYDSLSRLKEATNLESGTIKYTYDANGNPQTKRDARGIKTVYDYDALNRAVKRCYRNIGTSASLGMTTCINNNETPEANTTDVAYTYEDTAITSLKGVLTKVANGVSATEYTEFDSLSRIKKSKQTTGTFMPGDMTYAYNLSAALIEQKYPNGRVVKNVLDYDGNLSIVQSKKNQTAGFWNYALHFSYTAAGAVSSMQLGNGTWESTTFNSRLQPEQIALGTVQNGTDKLKLNYTYNTSGQNNNNGNILSQTITVPTETRNSVTYPAFTATQTYTYDSLNRLYDSKEMIGTTEQWKQTFLYDRYGNRRFDTTSGRTTTLESGCAEAICNPQIDVTKNRLVGASYDNAGNTTADAENKTFIYDGENKQVEVKNSLNQTIGQYFYDGDGKRVKKVVGTETTVFVYDASGRLVTEYATTPVPAATAKVSYLTNDHLGSPRINTDANGKVEARHDYRPFGEEIARASYGGDTVRKQFTGYERDGETELDFAQARYFNPGFGKFTSPDNFANDTHISDPQSWNLYTYVRNNPLKFVDQNGQELWITFFFGVNNSFVLKYVGNGKFEGYSGDDKLVATVGGFLQRLSKEFPDEVTILIDQGSNRIWANSSSAPKDSGSTQFEILDDKTIRATSWVGVNGACGGNRECENESFVYFATETLLKVWVQGLPADTIHQVDINGQRNHFESEIRRLYGIGTPSGAPPVEVPRPAVIEPGKERADPSKFNPDNNFENDWKKRMESQPQPPPPKPFPSPPPLTPKKPED